MLLLFVSFSAFSQKATYNKTNESGKFTEYQTKEGNVLKLGDTITIGYPLGNNFTFITQGDLNGSASLANKRVKISKIKSIGNSIRGYKTYILFSGYGISVHIDYEAALETGEIKNPFTQ